MTRLVWDQAGERSYESGVSQGVFYGADSKGIPWNGLSFVEETSNDMVDPLYFDGFKYADVVTLGDFEGKIKAFTYPDEFLAYDGTIQSATGFYLTDQQKSRFGLAYRTEVGNDYDPRSGYKIHLLYNLLAIPSDKTHNTLSLNVEPMDFEWDISAIPEEVDKFRPTAHVIIDSRKIDSFLLADIENIIYGTSTTDPLLPNLNGLLSFVQKWGRLIITYNGDGTWTAESPLEGVINMLDGTTFQIVSDTAVFIDGVSYTISSSEVNSEDIWPQ